MAGQIVTTGGHVNTRDVFLDNYFLNSLPTTASKKLVVVVRFGEYFVSIHLLNLCRGLHGV